MESYFSISKDSAGCTPTISNSQKCTCEEYTVGSLHHVSEVSAILGKHTLNLFIYLFIFYFLFLFLFFF